jgi:shikimate kinase
MLDIKITIHGPRGGGKTIAARAIANALKSIHFDYKVVIESGDHDATREELFSEYVAEKTTKFSERFDD